MSDTNFLNSILLATSCGATRMFRNSVGLGWIGETFRVTKPMQMLIYPGDVVVKKARALHAGLARGSGDLIGFRSVVIQPEDVGKRVAVFVSMEAKEGTGRMTPEQKNWRDQVQAAGGIAGEVRSVEDAIRLLSDER